MEKIYKKFETRKAEAIAAREGREEEFGPEKDKEILKEIVSEEFQEAEKVVLPEEKEIKKSAEQIKNQPKERQLQFLVDLALEKGIVEAVNLVRSLDNPYLLDEFHDTLVDQLYSQLVKEGKLKQI